jgi:GNAT superfamily N-acetyltransferase
MKSSGHDFAISVSECDDSPEAAFISENLRLYIEEKFGPADKKPFVAIARSKDQEILGGLKGFSHWHWFYIVQFWITESMRSKGFGKVLLEAAEIQARDRADRGLYVDTFETKTRDFYVHNGFKEVGLIKDFPVGTARIFLAKHF